MQPAFEVDLGRQFRQIRTVSVARVAAVCVLGLVLGATGCSSGGGSSDANGSATSKADDAANSEDVTSTTRALDYPRDPRPLPPDISVPAAYDSARLVSKRPPCPAQERKITERRDPLWFGDVRMYYPGRYVDGDGNYYMQLILIKGEGKGVDRSTAVVGAGGRFRFGGVIFEVEDVPADGYDSELLFWMPVEPQPADSTSVVHCLDSSVPSESAPPTTNLTRPTWPKITTTTVPADPEPETTTPQTTSPAKPGVSTTQPARSTWPDATTVPSSRQR